MKTRTLIPILAVLICTTVAYEQQQASTPPGASTIPTKNAGPSPFSEQELQQFRALAPIDTHTHVYQNAPVLVGLLKKLNMHILDIVVIEDAASPFMHDLVKENEKAWDVVHGSDGHASLCTGIDPYKFDQPDFSKDMIKWDNQNFAQGAIAVKIWKNVGEEIKDAKGNYILPDNPVFEPIYKNIEKHNKTLIAHLADPDGLWEKTDPSQINYRYTVNHPEWYMYTKANAPSKKAILAARDHILEQNPHLRVVGAHLGSMEDDLLELAKRLDRYPNFAVDLAARMPYLEKGSRADVIAFITKYQDRLIYATDYQLAPEANADNTAREWEVGYAADWRFFATDATLVSRGNTFQGLDLPPAILRKLYHDNAVRWFPGILDSSH